MVLSECYGFMKYSLACINLLFWAVGLSAVILSIWMLTDQTFVISVADEKQNFIAGTYIILVAGILMLLVAFLGCCGAFRESQCMLVGFFSCLLVVIVAQIAVAAWLYVNFNGLEKLIKESVTNTVKNEYGEIESKTKTLDAFQSGLGCCGATGPADWAGSKYANKDPLLPLSLTVSADNNAFTIPESCCKDRQSNSCVLARHVKIAGVVSPSIYSEGCIDKLMKELKNQSCIVLGVAIGIGILELLGLILSLVLCCAIGSSDRYKA